MPAEPLWVTSAVPAGPGQVVEVGGPHDRAVVDVDEADVVGAAEGDAVPARGLAELVRKYPALRARLGEPVGRHHGGADPDPSAFVHDVDGAARRG